MNKTFNSSKGKSKSSTNRIKPIDSPPHPSFKLAISGFSRDGIVNCDVRDLAMIEALARASVEVYRFRLLRSPYCLPRCDTVRIWAQLVTNPVKDVTW